jgi:hypothetical protein
MTQQEKKDTLYYDNLEARSGKIISAFSYTRKINRMMVNATVYRPV